MQKQMLERAHISNPRAHDIPFGQNYGSTMCACIYWLYNTSISTVLTPPPPPKSELKHSIITCNNMCHVSPPLCKNFDDGGRTIEVLPILENAFLVGLQTTRRRISSMRLVNYPPHSISLTDPCRLLGPLRSLALVIFKSPGHHYSFLINFVFGIDATSEY